MQCISAINAIFISKKYKHELDGWDRWKFYRCIRRHINISTLLLVPVSFMGGLMERFSFMFECVFTRFLFASHTQFCCQHSDVNRFQYSRMLLYFVIVFFDLFECCRNFYPVKFWVPEMLFLLFVLFQMELWEIKHGT